MRTSENDRPSLSNAKTAKALPFVPSSRHVQNVNVRVKCGECDLWRLLYSMRKLTLPERQQLQTILQCSGIVRHSKPVVHFVIKAPKSMHIVVTCVRSSTEPGANKAPRPQLSVLASRSTSL